MSEWTWRIGGIFFVLTILVGIPTILYMAVKQSRDCQARGGYQVRDLGCVDLKKIPRR